MNHCNFYGFHPFDRRGGYGRPAPPHMEEFWHGRHHWRHHHGFPGHYHDHPDRHHLIMKDEKAVEELTRILKDFINKKEETKDGQGKITEESSSSSEEEACSWHPHGQQEEGKMKHGRCSRKGRSHHHRGKFSKKMKHSHQRHGRCEEEPRRCIIILEILKNDTKGQVGREENIIDMTMDDTEKAKGEDNMEGESSGIRRSMEHLDIQKE